MATFGANVTKMILSRYLMFVGKKASVDLYQGDALFSKEIHSKSCNDGPSHSGHSDTVAELEY